LSYRQVYEIVRNHLRRNKRRRFTKSERQLIQEYVRERSSFGFTISELCASLAQLLARPKEIFYKPVWHELRKEHKKEKCCDADISQEEMRVHKEKVGRHLGDVLREQSVSDVSIPQICDELKSYIPLSRSQLYRVAAIQVRQLSKQSVQEEDRAIVRSHVAVRAQDSPTQLDDIPTLCDELQPRLPSFSRYQLNQLVRNEVRKIKRC